MTVRQYVWILAYFAFIASANPKVVASLEADAVLILLDSKFPGWDTKLPK